MASGATLSFGDTKGTESLTGGLWNNGKAAVNGVMEIEAPHFGLFGTGTLTLTGKIIGATALPQIFGNRSTIVGSGVIGGNADLEFVNQQTGVVNANASAVLTLNTGANQITNAGAIKTTGAGGLSILSNMLLDGQLTDTGKGAMRITSAEVRGGGDVTIGAGAATILNNGEFSIGGVVTIASSGQLSTTGGNLSGIGTSNAFIGDVLGAGDVQDNGAINISADSLLNVNATLYGTGSLHLLGATGGPSTLEIFGNGANFLQTGGILLSNSVQNKIVSNGGGEQLSNQTTIKGAGVIGDGWLRVANSRSGTILANDSASLTIVADTNAVSKGTESENFNDGAITNTGAGGLLIENGALSNAGTLTEDGAGALTLSKLAINTGGGSVVVQSGDLALSGNSSIAGQFGVTVDAAGVLTTTAGDTADALYSDITNTGKIEVVAGSTLDVEDHWINNGAILVGSSSSSATFAIEAGQVLELLGAGGTLQLANSGDKIVSGGAGTELENKTDIIEGAGTIGDANMSVNNEVDGVINANVTGGLVLTAQAEAGTTTFLYNAGAIEANTAAGVTIEAGMYSPGKMIADAGSKIVAQKDVFGAGTATINGAASIEFGGVAQNDVHFGATSGGEAIFDHSSEFSGDIFGLAVGDSFDLRDFHFVAGMTGIDVTQSSFGDAEATIVLVNGTSSSATIHLEGKYTRTDFQVVSDGSASAGALVKLVS